MQKIAQNKQVLLILLLIQKCQNFSVSAITHRAKKFLSSQKIIVKNFSRSCAFIHDRNKKISRAFVHDSKKIIVKKLREAIKIFSYSYEHDSNKKFLVLLRYYMLLGV